MNNWNKVKLGEVIETSLGKMLDSVKNRGEFMPYLANINVRWGSFDIDNLSLMRFEANEEEKYGIKYGDLIICEGGEPGRCAIWKDQIPNMKIQKALHRVRPISHLIDNFYLFYWFYNAGKKGLIDQYCTGATIKHLPAIRLKSILVDLPPIDVQHKIATILSRYDDLIENYQKQIKLLEEAAQRLYKEWFVELHFPGHENVKVVDGVPEGWEKKRLEDFVDITMGQSPKSIYYNKEGKGLPFHQGVGSYENRFVANETYTSQYTKIAEANSVLFSVRAPVGRLNLTKHKIAIGRGLAAMKQVDGQQSYLFYMLKEHFYRDDMIGNGSIFASISKGELYAETFVVPTFALRELFEHKASKIDEQIKVLDSQLHLLTEARDRLLPKLMSGEIEV